MEEEMPKEIQPQVESQEAPKPVFDAGIFTITNIATSDEGLKIQNSQQLTRRDENSPIPFTGERRPNTGEAKVLEDAMRKELKFTGGITAKEELDKLRQGQPNEYEAKRQEYVSKMRKVKVGIRHIKQDGNTVTIDTRPVPFPVYDTLATRETSNRPGLMDYSEATGTAAVLLTKDGKAILQYRSKTNGNYGNIPGASAAGMLDGELDPEKKGTLKPLTESSIEANLVKEATEELKVKKEDFKVNIVGIAHDGNKPHHEFMLTGLIDKTSAELAENGLIPDEVEGHDFRERFIAIDATPDAFEKLLGEVRCPLPPTHAAVYFMTGLKLARQKYGSSYARTWGERVSQAVKKNYALIDKTVIDNYDKFPAQIEGKPPRSKIGYDPQYFPEEQGLPSLLEELKRTNLINTAMYDKLKTKYGK
jgi:hypothetical protein